MHHGTCVTHVPWCMSGSLTCGDGENVPGIPGACAPAILRIWQEAHVWDCPSSTKQCTPPLRRSDYRNNPLTSGNSMIMYCYTEAVRVEPADINITATVIQECIISMAQSTIVVFLVCQQWKCRGLAPSHQYVSCETVSGAHAINVRWLQIYPWFRDQWTFIWGLHSGFGISG